jgi:hypothetical protein
MNKKWIVVRREYFDQVNVGEHRNPEGHVRHNPEDEPQLARPRQAPNRAENAVGVPQVNLDCWVFNNQDEATEWMEEALRGLPQQKFILLEMMCVYQIKPSPAVKMSWNERGELE